MLPSMYHNYGMICTIIMVYFVPQLWYILYHTYGTLMVTSVPYMYRNYGTCTVGTVNKYGTNYGREYTINVPQIWYKTWENYNLVVVVGCIDCKTVAIPVQFMFKNIVVDNTSSYRETLVSLLSSVVVSLSSNMSKTPQVFSHSLLSSFNSKTCSS